VVSALLGAVVVVFGGLASLSAAVNGGPVNPATIYFVVVGLLLAGVILLVAWLLASVLPPVPLAPAVTAPTAVSSLPARKDEDA
jgi:hypothetical protein